MRGFDTGTELGESDSGGLGDATHVLREFRRRLGARACGASVTGGAMRVTMWDALAMDATNFHTSR
jgi:hypothetical protein